MLDVISGGRLVAGFPVGLGYDAGINNGVPPLEIRPRFDENLELVLRAWRDREPFPWNGRFHQYPGVNIWPRPLQNPPPTWITGIGNPNTMRMTLERGFGFNYFSFAGAKLTGKRIFDRFWDLADQVGVPRNPYRLGFVQTVAIADTDAEAERDYGKHIEYTFRKGLGAIPPERLAVPGGIDIRGVRALLTDPADFGFYYQMRTGTFAQLADAGVVIAGSAATVRDQLVEYCRQYGIGNLHVMLGFGSLPKELALRNIELFARDVAPYLRDLWQDTEFEHHWWPERLGGVRSATYGHADTKEAVAS
jgi:alkanesulfonate monooxygenase SsuD/methylene tetrahydromethanopterin reductase-like flavin-dependent oxidoreductase (luciferase family)